MRTTTFAKRAVAVVLLGIVFNLLTLSQALSGDLEDIKKRGTLRQLGIPYANFVTGYGDGLDVEIMQRFAQHLGVRHEFVSSDWGNVFADLTGKKVRPKGDQVEVLGDSVIRGDVIANGLTVLAWRQKIINYSEPTFPTQVWCISRAGFPAMPIKSSGNIAQDIDQVRALLEGRRVMGKQGTCLDPGLYRVDASIAEVSDFPGSLNDIAPAIIKGEADIALLDVPDALVALEKWPGKIKVLGPLSDEQRMGVGFRKDSPELLKEFNAFYAGLRSSGEYNRLVQKYYPAVFRYFPEFFE